MEDGPQDSYYHAEKFNIEKAEGSLISFYDLYLV